MLRAKSCYRRGAVPSLETLYDKRLIVVVGKGGVGRTTISAALSLLLARRGRNTLLYQANAKQKLSQLLGGPEVGAQILRIRDRLHAVNTNPQAALHEYGLMVLRYETIYKMVFENRFARALVRAIPGVDDYSILGKAWYHTTEVEGPRPRWDTLVFDAPATGHAVQMMGIPRAILAAVPEGPLTRDAAKVKALLEDPTRTAVVIVTLAEEMPVNESVELAARFKRHCGLEPTCLIVNQLYPDRFHGSNAAARVLKALAAADSVTADPVLAPMLSRSRHARERREMQDRYLMRLAIELPLPTLMLETIFAPTLNSTHVERLSMVIEEQIDKAQAAA
jgi:anion-transporting  ArsA/GET3 family ATPase